MLHCGFVSRDLGAIPAGEGECGRKKKGGEAVQVATEFTKCALPERFGAIDCLKGRSTKIEGLFWLVETVGKFGVVSPDGLQSAVHILRLGLTPEASVDRNRVCLAESGDV